MIFFYQDAIYGKINNYGNTCQTEEDASGDSTHRGRNGQCGRQECRKSARQYGLANGRTKEEKRNQLNEKSEG